MFTTWLYTLTSVVLVSCLSLVGIFFITVNDEKFRRMILYLVSFSTGALFGDAFVHIIPEVCRKYGFGIKASLAVLAGILAFFALEKFVQWHHCHGETCDDHPHPVAYVNIIGDGVHNFIDGMIIAGSFMVDVSLGIATLAAVILHEIPTELGHYSILVYAGFTKKKALLFNFYSALTAVVGGVVTLLAGKHIGGLPAYLLPFTAGGFIYLAGSDLIPELHKEHNAHRSAIQLMMIVLGIGLMFLLLLVG